MFADEVVAEIAKVADELRVERAALLAVAEVESNGKVFAVVNGENRPLIRFEGHYFDRRLAGGKRAHARSEGLSAAKAGVVAKPASQAARWTMLERAMAIDRRAALESVSWGIGQVMGAHWDWLGYASVDHLVEDARSGAAGQARLMARFIEKAGLRTALRNRDWAAFARGYNGPGYKANAYHTKMAAAYRRFAATDLGRPKLPPAPAARVLPALDTKALGRPKAEPRGLNRLARLAERIGAALSGGPTASAPGAERERAPSDG